MKRILTHGDCIILEKAAKSGSRDAFEAVVEALENCLEDWEVSVVCSGRIVSTLSDPNRFHRVSRVPLDWMVDMFLVSPTLTGSH